MKKIIALLLAAIMIFAFAACSGSDNGESTSAMTETGTADDWEYISDKGTLVVGITEYKPMDYLDENGEWTGFDAEYATAVAKKLGLKVEFVEVDWDNKELELESRKVDCIWNGMTITDELKKSMSITDAYVVNAQVVVMSADAVGKYADAASMADLTFAVEAGSAGASIATENNFTVKEVDLQSTALLEVQSGKADACIIDITMANSMVGEGTSYDSLAIGISLTEEEYGVGCRLGSGLVDKINEATDALIADGTLATLAKTYELTLAD